MRTGASATRPRRQANAATVDKSDSIHNLVRSRDVPPQTVDSGDEVCRIADAASNSRGQAVGISGDGGLSHRNPRTIRINNLLRDSII
jgi:hypothetical protein